MIPGGSSRPLTLPSYFRIKDADQKVLYTRNGQLLVGDPDSENCSAGEHQGASPRGPAQSPWNGPQFRQLQFRPASGGLSSRTRQISMLQALDSFPLSCLWRHENAVPMIMRRGEGQLQLVPLTLQSPCKNRPGVPRYSCSLLSHILGKEKKNKENKTFHLGSTYCLNHVLVLPPRENLYPS